LKYDGIIKAIIILFVYLLIEIVVRLSFLLIKNSGINIPIEILLILRSLTILVLFLFYLFSTKNLAVSDLVIHYNYLIFFAIISLLLLFLENFVFGDSLIDPQELTQMQLKYIIFNSILVAPIVEEIICRKFILGSIGQSNIWIGLIISTTIFVLLHFQFSLIDVIVLTIYGLILGMCYIKTNSVINPILLHMMINAVQLSLYIFSNHLKV